MFTAGDRIQQLAIVIEDFNLQITKDVAALLIVSYKRIRRPAGTAERLVAFRPAAAGVHVLDRWPARKEDGIFLHQLRGKRPQRRNVVHNPDSTAVRGENQVALTRMHRDIAYRDRRKIPALVLGPSLSPVDRHPEPKL